MPTIVEDRPESDCDLHTGANTYAQALSNVGGRELNARKSAHDRSPLRAALYVAPPYALSVPPLAVHRLAVNLTNARVHGGFDGDRPRRYFARRHSLWLTPAAQSANWHKDSPSRHLAIYFHADAFNGSGEDAFPVPALFNATVPGIAALIDQFSDELQTPGFMTSEAADSLARLLLIRLARHLQVQRACTSAHWLTDRVMARLQDYVVAHLGERIFVADLAREAGLSANYFAQSFTAQTGCSPHKFVLRLRVRHAVELLTRSDSSFADIAMTCGFSSQQHLSNAVRRHTATTPGRIRALGPTHPSSKV